MVCVFLCLARLCLQLHATAISAVHKGAAKLLTVQVRMQGGRGGKGLGMREGGELERLEMGRGGLCLPAAPQGGKHGTL